MDLNDTTETIAAIQRRLETLEIGVASRTFQQREATLAATVAILGLLVVAAVSTLSATTAGKHGGRIDGLERFRAEVEAQTDDRWRKSDARALRDAQADWVRQNFPGASDWPAMEPAFPEPIPDCEPNNDCPEPTRADPPPHRGTPHVNPRSCFR